jgi:uncharacterized membrane protein
MAENRLESIERQLKELAQRLERLEGWAAAASVAPRPPVATSRPVAPRRTAPAAPAPAPVLPRAGLEELLGGRVLAWLGSVAILLGIVFFLGMAISRGWIDEPARTVLAFLGSSSLLVVGVWLYEKKGRVEAALAAVASALAGLFATLIVATQIYDLIPVGLGLGCAGLVGMVAVTIAVRWSSTIVAAIGILGALLAPVLVGAGTSGLSLTFMAIALAAAVGILLWQKWNWLSLGAFAVSAPQLVSWLADNYNERLFLTLAVLAGFWALYVVAAIGYELRVRSADALPVAAWFLLLGNVVLIAAAGHFALADTGHPNAAVAWLLGVAAAHILLGALALRQPISREIGSLLISAGLGLSAIGFADALNGPVLVAGWAVQAVVLAYLATRVSAAPISYGSNAERLMAGAAVYLALAFGHILAYEAPPQALLDGVDDLGNALVALGASAAVALACGLLWRPIQPRWGQLAELAGATALVYLASVAIIDTLGVAASGESVQAGQVWLSAFWTVTGLGAVLYGLRRGSRGFRLAGLALLGVAIAKVYTYDLSELQELSRALSFIALGLLLLVGAFAYQRIQAGVAEEGGRASR